VFPVDAFWMLSAQRPSLATTMVLFTTTLLMAGAAASIWYSDMPLECSAKTTLFWKRELWTPSQLMPEPPAVAPLA
jgi:hypothetical protein